MFSVEVLRGFAAIAVVFYHTHMILNQPEYGGIDVFGSWSSKGWLGVNFFFVLSGFIIFYAHRADIGRPKTLPRYVWRRVIRIYPMYWLAVTLYVLGAAVGIGHPDFSMTPWNLAWSYSLVFFADPLTLPLRVAWTLFYETFFYAMFALLLVTRRVGLIALGLWFAAIILANITGFASSFYALQIWNFYFLVGILINFGATGFKGWQGIAALVVGLVGVLVLTVSKVQTLDETRSDSLLLVALGVAFGLVILGAIVIERRWGWKPPKVLLLLGSASYSIYLFHSPVISVLAQLNAKFGHGSLPPEALFLSIVLISTVVGVVAHLVVERPLLSWLRGFEGRWPVLGRGASARTDANRAAS